MDKIRNRKPHIAVIGDLMIDEYIWGSCERISPEAPVQVVSVQTESTVLGGAGNVLSNLVALDAQVSLYSVIGDDSNAPLLHTLIDTLGLKECNLIIEPSRITTKKSRVIASGQQMLRFDDETTVAIGLGTQVTLFETLQKHLAHYDAILLSDYGKGVLTPNLCRDIISHANALHIPILIDPKGTDYSKYHGATLLTPNKKEAALASNKQIEDDTSLASALHHFKNTFDLTYAIITLSEDGIGLLDTTVKTIPTVAR